MAPLYLGENLTYDSKRRKPKSGFNVEMLLLDKLYHKFREISRKDIVEEFNKFMQEVSLLSY